MQTLKQSRVAYQGWAKVLQLDLTDETGQPVRREVVDTGEAVAVLPYDPERGVAMLVRQQRAPLLLGGGDGYRVKARFQAATNVVESSARARASNVHWSTLPGPRPHDAGTTISWAPRSARVWKRPGNRMS